MPSKPKIYILIGPAGIGKTTWRLANIPNASVVSNDVLLTQWAKERNITYNEMFSKTNGKDLKKQTMDDFKKLLMPIEKDIVIDNTNLTQKSRSRWIQTAKEISPNTPIVSVYFELKQDEHFKRLKKREEIDNTKIIPESEVYRMRTMQQKPNSTEKFDEFIFILS